MRAERIIPVIWLLACQEAPQRGTDSGNGVTVDERHFVGRLTAPLEGVRVLALSTKGELSEAPAQADGRFDVILNVNNAYVLHTVTDDTFVGTFYFAAAFGGSASRLTVGPAPVAPQATPMTTRSALTDGLAASVLDCGEASCESGVCLCEHNVRGAQDSDGDGLVDAEDLDSDGDRLPDHLQGDLASDDVPALPLLLPRKLDPAPGAHGVDPTEKIELLFNKPLAEGWQMHIALSQSGGSVTTTQELHDGGREVRLLPVEHLLPCTTYRLSVSEDLLATDGARLGRELSYTFVTECENDVASFALKKAQPTHAEDDVDLETEIELDFTQPVTTEALAAHVRLDCGARIAGVWRVDEEDASFQPDAPLPAMTSCTLSIDRDLPSASGALLGQDIVLTFHTRADDRHEEDEEEEEEEGGDSGG